jgi:hypothetical protein
MINQVAMPPATIARKPSTTMTAIAQCGKSELPDPDWTLPVARDEVDDGELKVEVRLEPVPPMMTTVFVAPLSVRVSVRENSESEAAAAAELADAAAADDAEATDAEDIDATTKSAYVVSV